jgi:hypothetical protein
MLQRCPLRGPLTVQQLNDRLDNTAACSLLFSVRLSPALVDVVLGVLVVPAPTRTLQRLFASEMVGLQKKG